jgi:hypothetical protein
VIPASWFPVQEEDRFIKAEAAAPEIQAGTVANTRRCGTGYPD